MAELAAAGSVAGLISLGIQSCTGLISYYTAWRSCSEEIGQICRNVEELKNTCEILESELHGITQRQTPAFQQVVRLIASCQDGIKTLRHALDQCYSTQAPKDLAAKIQKYRARALYPLRRQTLQTIKDTVHDIQGSLSCALQTLQLQFSINHGKSLASLAKTASGTETAVHNNLTAIQALSSPLQAIDLALPLIQQHTEDTAITVNAVHDEARESRQQALNLEEKILREIRTLGDRVDSSSTSLETAITAKLGFYGAAMSQMKHELEASQLQHNGEVVAKLGAMDQNMTKIQLGLISKPGLMQSVCQENHRLENRSTSAGAPSGGWLPPQDGRKSRGHRCRCKLNRPKGNLKDFFKGVAFELNPVSTWKFCFETNFESHDRNCPLFPNSVRSTVRLRIASCGALLAGAIEASISMTRGAGGLSISPLLQCASVVPDESPAFELIDLYLQKQDYARLFCGPLYPRYMEKSFGLMIDRLGDLFRTGKASPYDVDLHGNTLLHRAVSGFDLSIELGAMMCLLLRLGELCVPLNWTNDENMTFLNEFVLLYLSKTGHSKTGSCLLATSATELRGVGAECNKFSAEIDLYTWGSGPLYNIERCLGSEELDTIADNELSLAILQRSERKLVKALRNWPQFINEGNGLAQTPLHLAAGWTNGVRILLQHGASPDLTDKVGDTPLEYAIGLGCSETAGVLMKADCNLTSSCWWRNYLDLVIQAYENDDPELRKDDQEWRTDLLDTVIVSLAERRRDLQSRLTDLPIAVHINTAVLRDDRVLDEYAEYAESVERDAQMMYDHTLLRGSSLLGRLRTVYHVQSLSVDIAEKLWENGFRDIDVQDENGMTPLMIRRYTSGDDGLVSEIEVCSWLIQKGANLHQPQHSPLNHFPNMKLDPMQLIPATTALNYVAVKIGAQAGSRARIRFVRAEQPFTNQLSRISKNASLLLTTIFSDILHDDCVCACSSQGCLASTMMLKAFGTEFVYPSKLDRERPSRKEVAMNTEALLSLLDSQNSCWDWLAKEVIRFHTFQELELRHTCCEWNFRDIVMFDTEERVEIQNEDQEKIELLETLLREFEEERGTQDLQTFLGGYWAMRMDQVLEEQANSVDEKGLREIGVVLHRDQWEEIVSSDEDGQSLSDEDGHSPNDEDGHSTSYREEDSIDRVWSNFEQNVENIMRSQRS